MLLHVGYEDVSVQFGRGRAFPLTQPNSKQSNPRLEYHPPEPLQRLRSGILGNTFPAECRCMLPGHSSHAHFVRKSPVDDWKAQLDPGPVFGRNVPVQ